jgi:hypothetical protein
MAPFFALLAALQSEPPSAPFEPLQCPADPAIICQAEAGPNHAFLYAYPAAIREIPLLLMSFRRSQSRAWERFQAVIAEARSNPSGVYTREEIYTVDADRPELLALAVRQVQRTGGVEARWSVGSLIWDRRGGALITFEQLFEEPEAGRNLVNALFCPAFRQARDAALGGRHEDCPDDYFARLVPGSDGRIGRLHLSFDPIDGPDDGQFDVEIPVTPALIESLQRQYRPAFAASEAPVTTCRRASAGEPCR